MANNNWKVIAIGLILLIAAVGITAWVVRPRSESVGAPKSENVVAQRNESAPQKLTAKTAPVEHHRPTQAMINQCNDYAASQVSGKSTEVFKDAAIGGVAGAGTGAAGGAIADGGSGAGKGSAIGAIVGVVGGTLYGLNKNKGHDERYQKAYASCMRSHGYE